MTLEEAVEKLTPEELEVLNSDDNLLAQFKAKYGGATSALPTVEPKKTQGLFGTSFGENSELLRKVRIPAQMSREGIGMITGAIPDAETPSVAKNILLNTPRTLLDIVGEFSSGMLEPETAVTAGTLKALPLLAKPTNAIGRFVGNTLEKMSGLGYKTPGVLAETVDKDPALPFRMGIQKARQLYEKVKDSGVVRDTLKFVSEENPTPIKPILFIKRAMQYVKDGSISPKEALKARQALDEIKDTLADDAYHASRTIFDKIAKTKYADADKAFSTAIKSDALRNFWGINKGQTPSLLKQGLSLALPITGPFFSPMVQGIGASALGVGKAVGSAFTRNPIQSAIMAGPTLRKMREEE